MIKRILFSIAALILFFCGKSQAQEVQSIKNAIDTSTVMSENIKTILKLETSWKGSETEKFQIIDWGRNGFSANIIGENQDEKKVSIRIYEAYDGKYYVVYNGYLKCYYAQGRSTKSKMYLPFPQLVRNYSRISTDDGLCYRGTIPETNEQFDEWYLWNGVNFVADCSVQHAVDTSSVMSEDAKQIFRLIRFNEYDYGYFGFNKEFFYCGKDRLSALIEDKLKPGEKPETHLSKMSFSITYQLYKTNSGKYLAAFCIDDINQVDFWYYENGKLIKAKDILPKPAYNKKTSTCSYIVFQNRIECNIYNRNTQQTTNEMYTWNGEKFVKQE